MSRKEHDRPDPSLIIEGARRHQRSKRVQGLDYPVTPLEELKQREHVPGNFESANLSKSIPEGGNVGASRDIDRIHRPMAFSDSNMPVGEACNADGTLKDASEIEWLHSPSSQPIGLPPLEPISHLESKKSDDELVTGKRKRPSHASQSKIIVSSDEDEDLEVESESEGKSSTKKVKKPKVLKPDGGEEAVAVAVSHAVSRPEKNAATKDLRLCLKDDTQFSKEKNCDVKGAYCKFCLEIDKRTKNGSWLTGNVTSRRRHLFRFHLDQYYKICQKNGVEPKPPAGWTPPVGWKPPGSSDKSTSGPLTQQSLNDFAVKVVKPTAVTKQGIQEHLLAIIATCDLPFRFCERQSLRRFILYLNPKLTDNDIPKKSSMADSVNKKLVAVDELTRKLIKEIPSKISIVWDGWTTKNRRPYTSVSISYIYSPPTDETLWTLKNMLIEFNSPIGRHTGEMIGKDLVATLRKYGVDIKCGWFVGDAVSSNDVAVRYVAREIDPTGEDLDPKDIRIRCVDHSMHRAAYHFIKALDIPSLMRTKKAVSNNKDDDDDDVDMSPDIEASSDDVDAMLQTTVVDFDAGDVVGKLLAFVNQVRMSSEGVRDYLKHACSVYQVKEILLRLWVRTRWGSLSDCFGATLAIQKAIDYFCLTADSNEDLPALTKGKTWSDYRLTSSEWKLVKLVHHCLKLIADRHNELSVEDSPTCSKVYPLLELLLSDWEDLLDDEEYAPVHDALRAGIACLEKYYKKADDTSVYFISHVLDPTRKLDYLNAAWEEEYIEKGMEKMRAIFLRYKNKSSASDIVSQSSATSSGCSTPQASATDAWMDRLIKKHKGKGRLAEETHDSEDPFAELNRWFETKALPRSFCPNPIAWWGHQAMEYPVLRLMARDYLAIPGTSCIAERSFSLSGRTDDPRRRHMDGVKFGSLQKLRAAYNDGRLDADLEAIRKYVGDFSFEDDDYN